MFSTHTNKVALINFLIFVLILFSGCSTENEKIPITTISQESRDLYVKGLSLADRLRRQEAVEYFKDAIAIDSNFAMAYIGLAFALYNQNSVFPNLQRAISLKEQVSPGEKLWIEAVESQMNNQTENTRDIIKKLILLYPNDERVHNFYATTFFGTQDYQESIKHYLKALEINSQYSQVYNQLGYAYRFLQNYNEAEKMFESYIKLIPNDPNPYDSYGELLLKMGKFDKSIANYEKALKVNPSFTFSYLGIASNLNYKNEHVKARNRLQALLTRAHNDDLKRIAYQGIIVSYIDEGNLLAALKVTEKMRQLAMISSDTVAIANESIMLGNLYIEMGRLDDAETLYNYSLELLENSNFPEQVKLNSRNGILSNIAIVHLKRNNIEDARKIIDGYSKYAQGQNNPNLTRFSNQLYGRIAFAEKQYESAIELFRKSNQNNPYNIYRIALAYELQGDNERAQSYFSKAAHANVVSNRNYSFIRKKALQKIQP